MQCGKEAYNHNECCPKKKTVNSNMILLRITSSIIERASQTTNPTASPVTASPLNLTSYLTVPQLSGQGVLSSSPTDSTAPSPVQQPAPTPLEGRTAKPMTRDTSNRQFTGQVSTSNFDFSFLKSRKRARARLSRQKIENLDREHT
jgi:hypothetical protein